MGIISRLVPGRTKEKAARQDKRSAIIAAVKCAIEPLEARLLLSTTNAWKSALSGDFDNPAMWSLGHVPTSSEDAVINVAGTFAITHNTAAVDSVHSFVSNQGFTLSAGTLAAVTTVEVDNTFNLAGGTLQGGTVLSGPGGQGITGSSGTLDGVTLSGGLTLTGTTLNVKDGLTLSNGAVVALNDSANLYFLGTQTLGGSGAVAFGGTNQSSLAVHSVDSTPANAATLTVASSITIHSVGASGSVSANYYGDEKLINQGTITSDVAGKTIFLGTITNSGATVSATNGGTLSLGGSIIGGTVSVLSGGQVTGGGTLDGVTLSGGLTLAGTTLNVKDGLTLSNGAVIALNDSANLYFLGTQTLGGSGAVAFGGTNQSSLAVHSVDSTPANAATLTVASGITIHSVGASGSVSANYYGDEKLINQGTITSDVAGKTISVNGGGSGSNSGTLKAINGGILSVSGVLTGQGSATIDATSTLTINGTIGGTITGASGAQFGGGGTLDGVTLSGGLTLTGTTLNVKDGLTLSNGAVVALNDSANLYFLGTQTLGGSGAVAFGGTNQSSLAVHSVDSTPANAATLTVASSITIHSVGASGSVSANYYGDEKLINQGTITSDVAGKTITLNTGTTFTNSGSLIGGAGSLNGSVVNLSNTGTITISLGSSFTVSGNFTQSLTGALGIVLGGSSSSLYGHLAVGGTASLSGSLNITESNGFTPSTGNGFTILTYSSATGQFSNYTGLDLPNSTAIQPAYNPTSVTLTTVTSTTIAPDLRVTNLTTSPSSPQSSQNLTINWNDFNAGNGSTGASWVDHVVVTNTTTGQTLSTVDVPYNAATSGNLPSNSSSARSYTFRLPDGPAGAGNLQITVTTDYNNTIAEFYPGNVGESNNATTITTSSILANYPDLQVGGLVVATTSPQSGQNLTINWNDKNTGLATTSGNWTDQVQIVNTTTGQTLVTTNVPYLASTSGNVAAGGTSPQLSYTFRLPDGAGGVGHLSITVTTNINGDIYESNATGTATTNNVSATTTTSTIAMFPDLQVSGLSTTPTSPLSGQQLTFNWNDLNSGTAATPPNGNFVDHVTVVNTTTGQTLASQDVTYNATTLGVIGAGASAARSLSFTLPAGHAGVGTLSISVTTNSQNTIFEYNATGTASSNSTATISATSSLAPSPDLQIAGLATNPASGIQSGQTVSIQWNDSNTGNAATAAPFYDHVKVVNSTTGTILADTDVLMSASIAAGALLANTYSLHLPDGTAGVGTLQITVTADSQNTVTEYNNSGTGESNNVATISVASTLASYPDLQVANLAVATASPVAGQNITVNWKDSNTGVGPTTENWSDGISIVNTTTGVTLINTTVAYNASTRGAIAAGSQSPLLSYSFVLPNGNAGVGVLKITVTTNVNADLYEYNGSGTGSSNNTATVFATSTLTAPADLSVSNVAGPAQGISGQPIQVSWAVTNQGTVGATGTWNDDVYLSPNADGSNAVYYASFPFTGTVAAGQSYSRVQNITLPTALQGNRYVVVTTNAANNPFESQRGNNTAVSASPVNVVLAQSPDLTVDSVTAPSSAFSGQPVSVSWIIKNVGNGSTNAAGWIDKVYLSSDGTLDANDALLGSVRNTSYLNAGDSYQSSLTATLPQGLNSNYRFIVVTDANNSVADSTESNNTGVSGVTLINLTPPPDLFVSKVSASTQAFSGQHLQVSYTVVNQGLGGTVQDQWSDQVYVSYNGNQLDSSDTLLATVAHKGVLASGQSYSVSGVDVVLPIGITGSAYLIVKTDSGNQVFEYAFETNNASAEATPTNVLLTPPPDLAVTSINAPSAATAGQPFTVSYTVKNEGATGTPNSTWTDSIYLSSDATLNTASDLLLGTRVRNGILNAGQSETQTYSFTLPNTLSGNYYLIVSSDSTNQVFELDNTNNIAASTAPTAVAVAPPDLVVSGVTTNGSPATGRSLTVNYTVTNNGPTVTPVSAWNDGIYLSTDTSVDNSDVALAQKSRVGVLSPGQSVSYSEIVTLPTDHIGAFYLLVSTDTGNVVYETNKTNNTVALPITVADDRPDLQVQSLTPHLGTGPVYSGSTLTVDYSIINHGGATFGTKWVDRLVLSQDGTLGNADDLILGEYASPATLAAGASYSQSGVSFNLPLSLAAGTYQLFLVTDARGSVPETLENNNTASVPLTITSGIAADLQVTALTAPATAVSGGNLNVAWTVTNAGQATTNSSPWTDTVWLSSNGVVDNNSIRLGSFDRSSALDPGQSYTRSASFSLGIDLSGAYSVIVQTDSGNTVFEAGAEGNNQRVSTPATNISLSPTPDLSVSNVTAPAQISSGRSFNLSWTVNNAGGADAVGNWNDSVYLSLDQVFDPKTDISLGFVQHTTGLAAGGQYTGTGSFTVPSSLGGQYFVFVVTDSTNNVYERNAEGNNSAYTPQAVNVVHIPPADFVVGDITVPTNGQLGQNATITYTVNNIGPNPATGSWSDALYLSKDGTWDINDALIGTVAHTGTVAAGDSYTSTLTAPIPGVLPGNYKIIVRSDILNNIPDSNENNNLTASLNSVTIDAPTLALGVASSGTLLSNGAVYYKVNVPAGDTLLVNFNSAASSGFTELYASYGSVPNRSEADFSAISPFHQNQQIVVPITKAGTYYIMAYGTSVPAGTTPFTITARGISFGVLDSDYGSAGNTGPITLKITGAKFTDATTAKLTLGGTTIAAQKYWSTDSSTLYATFNLASAAIGQYSLVVSDPAGGTASVPASLNVVAGRGASVTAAFVNPAAAVTGTTYPISVEIGNNGTSDGYAPVVILSSERLGTLFGTSPGNVAVQTLQFLGINNNGPAGIYSPEQSSTYNFFGKAKGGANAVDMRLLTADDTTTINWSTLGKSLKPSTISDAAWAPVLANLSASITTYGQYVIALNKAATYLSQIGERVSDVSTLWSFVVEQAMGSIGPVQTLSSSVDAQVTTPGISLSLSRSFGSGLASRNASGMFGQGSSTQWDSYLAVNSDGSVSVSNASQVLREFTPIANSSSYTALPGDTGTLQFTNGQWEITESNGQVTAYRPDGRIDFIQDANSNRVTATWTNGLLTRLTHSAGQYLTIAYNAAGHPTSVTDSTGQTTTYTYDATNKYLISVTKPGGITTKYSYVTSGGIAVQNALSSIAFPGGTHQYFTYDSLGRLAGTSQDGGASPQTLVYVDDEVQITNGTGNTSKVDYNENGQIAKTIDALGNITRYAYDGSLNLSSITNATGNTETYAYNSVGEVVSSTDYLGYTTNFNYSGPQNKLSMLTDANGNATQYGYDGSGNLLSTTYADGSSTSSTYDPEGNALSFLNARGQTVGYTYNAAGQVTQESFADGSKYTYTYDGHGNLLTATDATGITTFTYDPTTLLMTEVAYPNGLYLKFSYNTSGQRTRMVDQTGFTTNYAYDSAGRLSQLTDGSGDVIVTYHYDAAGRLSSKNNGNGTYTTYTYDGNGNVLHLINYASGGAINSRFDYTYNAVGLVATETTTDGTWTYGYDADGQLTHAVFASINSGIPNQSLAYQYDPMGNRVTTVINGVSTAYTTNKLNEYTSVGGQAYTYDADGNLLSDGSNSYTYNSLNQLTGAAGAGGATTYAYDALGDRTNSKFNGLESQYLLDPFSGADIATLVSDNGGSLTHYSYGIGLVDQTNLNGTSYYDFDALGSSVGMTPSSANTSLPSYSSNFYLPFGEELGTQQGADTPFQFVGEWSEVHDTSGLLLTASRGYSTTLGRFISPDPTGLAGGDVNLVRYGFNDPVSLTDPLGTSVFTTVGHVIGDFFKLLGRPITEPPPLVGPAIGAATGAAVNVAQGKPAVEPADVIGATLNVPGLATAGAAAQVVFQNPTAIVTAIEGFKGRQVLGDYDDLKNQLDQQDHPVGAPVHASPPPVDSVGAPQPPALTQGYSPVHSGDPNDLFGPAGVGEQKWVSSSAPLAYVIDFENDPAIANGPAQVVKIVQNLDSDLDPQSFRLGSFGFGSTIINVPDNVAFYSTRLDLTSTLGIYLDVAAGVDVAAGQIFWQFTSIDPATGAVPTDKTIGFLPLNVLDPEGDGFVNYSIRAKDGAANGSKIDAQATVYFDNNAPIDTPAVFNTLDAAAPTSAVAVLAPTQGSNHFAVNWSGNDGDVGSGVSTYTIYVSDNGGNYVPWLTDTALTTADFEGTAGHTYAFYSLAKDAVGNVEDAPPSPDATTKVIGNTAAFSGLTTTQSISFGTPSITFAGKVSSGALLPTAGEVVAVTFNGVTTNAVLDTQGNFSATFNAATLPVSTTPYTATYAYAGNATLAGTSDSTTSTVVVNRAVPTVSVSSPVGGFTYNGLSTLTNGLSGSITGVAGATAPTGTLSIVYYTGSSATGTPLASPPINAGTYTTVAAYAGDGNYAAAQSSAVTFTINKAAVTVTLAPPPSTIAYDGTNSVTSWVKATVTGPTSAPAPSGPINYTYYAGATATGTALTLPPINAGTYTVVASYGGSSNYLTLQSTPVTFTIAQPAAPLAVSFKVDDGTAQRSMVRSLTVTFSSAVTLQASGITLTDSNGNAIAFTLSTTDNTTYKLTFVGSQYLGGSLANGRFVLAVHAGKVTGGGGAQLATDQTLNFWRLYGDYYGTASVNNADKTLFKQVYKSQTAAYLPYFDYDGNGVLNATDLNAFNQDFGKSI